MLLGNHFCGVVYNKLLILGIEAADLTSLLEQFEESQCK